MRMKCDFENLLIGTVCAHVSFCALSRAHTHTHMPNTIVDVALALDFRIVNINYNEVYKHCLFIVMYYDVQ